MAQARQNADLYRKWLVFGMAAQALILIVEYFQLSGDEARYEYFAILIERQLLTFAITAGALFAAAWSVIETKGQQSVLAGVIASQALALLSVHFDYWERLNGEVEPWASALANLNVEFAIPLLLIPIVIAMFAATMEGVRDGFAENHSRRRKSGIITTAFLWIVLAAVVFIIVLYDTMLLKYFDRDNVAEYTETTFKSLFSSLFADPTIFFTFVKDAGSRPVNWITPLFTGGAAAGAQVLVAHEIRWRVRQYDGRRDDWTDEQ